MLPRHHPGRVQITFDGHRLAANAGLILPGTLARRLGLPQLLRKRLGLGDAPGRANTGDKLMTLAPPLRPAAIASVAPVRCAPAGPPAFPVSRPRLPPPRAPSCAASGGAMSASWTG